MSLDDAQLLGMSIDHDVELSLAREKARAAREVATHRERGKSPKRRGGK
jgi:hypothetical protein